MVKEIERDDDRSMDDILDSIRQIIDEDEADTSLSEVDTDNDVVELTESVTTPETLVSKKAEETSVEKIAQLKGALNRDMATHTASKKTTEDVTLTTFVQSIMTPLLKSWMDKHLPSLVEKVVAQEIKRLVDHAQEE